MKMKYLLIIAVFLSFNLTGISQESFKITHGPYICDMSETGATIIWTTSNNALSWVEVAPNDGTNFYSYERPRYFESKFGKITATSTLHKVRINDLKPGSTYRYAIFSKEVLKWENDKRILFGITIANYENSRNPLTFKTFSSEDDSVSFLIFNDIHGRAQFMKDLCKNIDFKNIDMVIFNGDMSTTINSEEQLFTDFIDASVELFATGIPIAFTRGNHETRGPYADFLMDYFPKKNGTIYQLLNVGKVAFLLLDCGENKPDSDIEYGGLADYDAYRVEEAGWLSQTVQSKMYKDASIKLVILHMPPMLGEWHGPLHLRETFLPLLNEANVTCMFSGHTHDYSFNPPVKGKINFPVLVNGNNACLRCDIIKEKVKVTIVTNDGNKPQEILMN